MFKWNLLASFIAAMLAIAAVNPEEAHHQAGIASRAVDRGIVEPLRAEWNYRMLVREAERGSPSHQFSLGWFHASDMRVGGLPNDIVRDSGFGLELIELALEAGDTRAQWWWYLNRDSSRTFLESAAGSPLLTHRLAGRMAHEKPCGTQMRAELSDSLRWLWDRFAAHPENKLNSPTRPGHLARDPGTKHALLDGALLAEYDARCAAETAQPNLMP